MSSPEVEKYISELKKALETDDMNSLDFILEHVFTASAWSQLDDNLQEILDEATLYLELKELEYKEKALELIDNF